MAPQRRPLGTISGNKIKKQELTPYKRGQIIGAAVSEMTTPVHAKSVGDALTTDLVSWDTERFRVPFF
jgi:hypothetical protein